MQYVQLDYFYSPDELARSSVKVFGDKVKTRGKLPGLMEGYVSPIDKEDWYNILIAKLAVRPFEGKYALSRILVPEYAMLHSDMETVGGRQAYVVDAKRPDELPYFARIWIDKEGGVPLLAKYFDQHPTIQQAEVISEVNDIMLHCLPNGGWIPREGVRSVHFRGDSIRYYEHVSVDRNSITVDPEDIPESLFTLQFANGARIYDVISGLTSVVGRPLKTYEQVVEAGGNFIAGTVVDPSGVPVPEVVVGVCAVKTRRTDGKFSYRLIGGHDRPCAITDTKGRLAIELEQEASYDLQFFPKDFVDKRLRDVPLGERNLRITLNKGGTVTGRVVRIVNGQKVPVANTEVEAQEGDRMTFASLRFGRLKATTGSQGRFQIRYLSTRMPKRRLGYRQEQQYVPRLWRIRCGPSSKTILFEDGISTQEVELVLKPDMRAAPSLAGRTLPDFKDIGIDVRPEDIKDQKVLLCFWDMEQRPSRRCIIQLAKQVQQLKQKGVTVVAVKTSKIDKNTLSQWVKKYNIPFAVGMVQGDEEKTRFAWGVRSLPWLILTNRRHIVTAEGFSLAELSEKIKISSDF